MMAATHSNQGSSTCVLELQPPQNIQQSKTKGQGAPDLTLQTRSGDGNIRESIDRRHKDDADAEPPAEAGPVVHALERWNSPASNIPRTFATFWSFVIMGANDAAYGVS
jgi:hypothetical protein